MLYNPFVVTSAETIHKGTKSGDSKDRITKKRIWVDSEVRMIEDTYTNRAKAFEIDALVRLIISVQTYSILGKQKITSNDDNVHKQLLSDIKTKLFDNLDLIAVLRSSMPNLKKDGCAYFQKRYAIGTINNKETREIESIQKLEYVEKYSNPTNPSDYYLFQNVEIKKNWQDPLSKSTTMQKSWYIKGGEAEATKNKNINLKTDKVIDLKYIIDIQNNESGDSSLTACLTQIFIKHLIFMHFPNLVALVVTPGVMFSYSTKEENGVPQQPDTKMAESNPTEYAYQKKYYEEFKIAMKTIVNNLEADWMTKGIVSMPDYITAKIMESSQALNADMLDTMLNRLNREIAFALNFPLSLLDAQGVELSTSRNILTTMSLVMKGVQDQYVNLIQSLIEEQFPAAKAAGIVFEFSELDPRDAKDYATIEKLHADVIRIYKDVGASEDDIRALSSKYDILSDLELGGTGIVKSEAVIPDEYSESDIAMAGRSLRQIMDNMEEEKKIEEV